MMKCSTKFLKSFFSAFVYTQRFQKLIYLHLFTDCFIKIAPQSLKQIQFQIQHMVIDTYLFIYMHNNVSSISAMSC